MPFTKTPVEGAICPHCGGQIYHTDRFIMCENEGREPDDCHFFTRYTQSNGKPIPDEDIVNLCNGQKVGPYTFTSQKGNKFQAYLVCNTQTGEITFEFADDSETTSYKCPKCGAELTLRQGKFGPYYSCPNRDFHMSAERWEHKFTDEEVRKLLNGEAIALTGLISQKGTSFDATVSFDLDTQKFVLSF